MTGHTLGAAGGIEAIATALSLREGVVPPTINYTTPDPECDLDYVRMKRVVNRLYSVQQPWFWRS